jgi:hypothetical protein
MRRYIVLAMIALVAVSCAPATYSGAVATVTSTPTLNGLPAVSGQQRVAPRCVPRSGERALGRLGGQRRDARIHAP